MSNTIFGGKIRGRAFFHTKLNNMMYGGVGGQNPNEMTQLVDSLGLELDEEARRSTFRRYKERVLKHLDRKEEQPLYNIFSVIPLSMEPYPKENLFLDVDGDVYDGGSFKDKERAEKVIACFFRGYFASYCDQLEQQAPLSYLRVLGKDIFKDMVIDASRNLQSEIPQVARQRLERLKINTPYDTYISDILSAEPDLVRDETEKFEAAITEEFENAVQIRQKIRQKTK